MRFRKEVRGERSWVWVIVWEGTGGTTLGPQTRSRRGTDRKGSVNVGALRGEENEPTPVSSSVSRRTFGGTVQAPFRTRNSGKRSFRSKGKGWSSVGDSRLMNPLSWFPPGRPLLHSCWAFPQLRGKRRRFRRPQTKRPRLGLRESRL